MKVSLQWAFSVFSKLGFVLGLGTRNGRVQTCLDDSIFAGSGMTKKGRNWNGKRVGHTCWVDGLFVYTFHAYIVTSITSW